MLQNSSCSLYALIGADNTGCLSVNRKAIFWKAFIEAEKATVNCLSELGGAGVIPGVEIMASIEKSVFQLCLPKTKMCSDGGYLGRDKLSWRGYPQPKLLFNKQS